MPPSILTINGARLTFETGQTILAVARGAGIPVPTLCDYKDTIPTGACRVCVVEVEGARTLLPACATQAAPGMVVQTESPRVVAARQMVIELLLASGNHNCLICEANGECELQALAYRYQVETPRFANPPDTPYYYEDDNSMIVRDFSKCVMCGECLQACPVGALLDKYAMGRGRSWERTQVRTTCPYCGVGCQMDVHVKEGRIVKVSGADAVPNDGKLCVKGRFGWRFVDHPDRLKTPLIKENGAFREATWEEALDLVASRLQEVRDQAGPAVIGGWCSARVTNEENYLMQKFLRAVIGTNHVDHCARL
jgi:predicted molibdopterin-dependent oxidoreductase YjgC